MLEGILERILQRIFGEYIENFDRENLRVGVWSGNVQLANVLIKKNNLNKVQLPFALKFGKIRFLKIIVPWRKITNSPVEVFLDGLYLVFTTQRREEWTVVDTLSPKVKEEALQALSNEVLKRLEQKAREGIIHKGSMGFWERIMVKAIDNLQINVKDIHARFEDDIFCKSHCAFGVTLQSLNLVTTDETWAPRFIDRTKQDNRNRPLYKHLKVNGLVVYWKPTGATAASRVESEKEVDTQMLECSKEVIKQNYVLKPLSLEVKFIQSGKAYDYTKPRYTANIAIDSLEISMKKSQFDNLVHISKLFEQYQKMQFEFEDTKRYKIFRPLYPILKTSKTQKITKVNLWWKYAFTCIKRKLRENKGEKGQFRISDIRLRMYQHEFMVLYAKIINNKVLTENEKLHYNKILYIFSIQQLKIWAELVLNKVEKRMLEMQQKTKPKEEETGWLAQIINPSKVEEEKNTIADRELRKLCTMLKIEMESEQKSETQAVTRADEYYWIVGDFTLNKVVLKIQRSEVKENATFKEAIFLKLERIKSEFMKRFNGMDLNIGMENIVLTTYSSFGSNAKIKNVILSQNPLAIKNERNFAFVKIRVLPPNTPVQIEIEAKAKSLRLYYLPFLISRVLTYLGKEEIRSRTYNMFNELRTSTQDTINATLTGKKYNLIINVESPVILIPIFKNNDPSSPIWCFKLGDIKISSKPRPSLIKEDEPIYDKLEISLTNINMSFYSTLIAYEDYEKQIGTRSEDRFDVVTDFSLLMTIGLLITPKKSPSIPSRKLKCTISSLQLKLNPLLYGHMLNIPNVFFLEDDDGAWRELARDRHDIMKVQQMAGLVKKRGNGITKYWYNYRCYLAGGYLYFYEVKKQEQLDSYFYLNGATSSFGKDELGIDNTIILSNKIEDCCLAFTSGQICKDWKEKIDVMIKDTSILSKGMCKKITEVVDLRNVLEEVKTVIGLLMVELYDEEGKQLIKGILEHIECGYLKRSEDIMIKFKLYTFELFHPDNKHFNKIGYNEPYNDLLSLSAGILSNKSPDYNGQLMTLTAQVGKITLYYPPELTKKLIAFLKIKIPEKEKSITEKIKTVEHLNTFEEEAQRLEEADTCQDNLEFLVKVDVSFETLKFHFLHPIHDSLFFLVKIDSTNFEYARICDHESIRVLVGIIVVSDLTNYPRTTLPRDFTPSRVRPQKLLEILPSYHNDDNACVVEVIKYKPHCPKRPLTPENFQNKIEVKIGMMRLNFVNEYLTKRFVDYITNCLVESISPKELAAQDILLYEITKTVNKDFGLDYVAFLGSFSSIDITVHRPLIYLRPRTYYADYFLVDFGNLRVWNERQWCPGRWLKNHDQKLMCDIYHVDITALTMNYSEKCLLLESCHFFVQAEIPCIASHDYCNHDPARLDQSVRVKIDVPKILKVKIKPEHFTYFMKCLDLNLTFKDNNDDKFDFKRLKPKKLEEGIQFDMECFLPIISLVLVNVDESNLAEFVVKEMNVSIIGNNDESKVISLGASYLYLLHNINPGSVMKEIILAPLFSPNEVSTDDIYHTADDSDSHDAATLKPIQIKLHILKDKTKLMNVKVVKHKVFMQLYLAMLIGNFLINNLPNYKNCPDQPNEYTDNSERNPKSVFTIMLSEVMLLLPSENIASTLVIRCELSVDYMKECIAAVKCELLKAAGVILTESDLSKDPADSINIKNLVARVNNIYVFMCDARNLDGRNLRLVKKRRILDAEAMKFTMKESMQFDKLVKTFKNSISMIFEGKQAFIAISYKDIINLANAFVYNMKMIDREYFPRIMQYNKTKSCYEQTIPEKVHFENNHSLIHNKSPPACREMTRRPKSEFVLPSTDDSIIKVLARIMKAFAHLKKASEKLTQYKVKATEYARKSQQSKQTSGEMKLIRLNTDVRGLGLFERAMNKKKEEESAISGSFRKSGVLHTTSNKDSKTLHEIVNEYKKVTFESIKILFLNDYKSVFYPILNINLLSPQFKEKNKAGTFSMQISSMYYNPIASFWEPLIEQSKFVIEMDNFSFKLRCKQGIDINISDTFIDVLTMTWKSWNEKRPERKKRELESRSMTQELGEKDDQGVCPFRVKNKTGITIYLSKMFGKKEEKDVAIPSGGRHNICVNYEDTIETLLKGSSNDVKLTETMYEVSFNPELNYMPITELQFNKVESQVHHLTESNGGLNYLIWSITLDKMIKLVTLRTALELTNKTSYKLRILFSSEDSHEFIIAPNDSFCIPIQLMTTSFTMYKEDSKCPSLVQIATDLINFFSINTNKELKIGNIFVVLNRDETLAKELYNISIIPPYSFKNALPCAMRFRRHGDILTEMLSVGEERAIYASSVHHIVLELMLPGYVSAVFRYSLNNTTDEFKVSFVDRANLPFKACVKVVNFKRARCSFYLYTHGCILNKTECGLVFYYSSATRGQLIAGQSTDYEALMISKRPNIRVGIDYMNTSRQLLISAAGVTTPFEVLKMEPNGLQKVYQFVLTTSLSIAVQDEYIYTKIITISPNYIFYNSSDMYLQVVQEGCYEPCLTVNPDESRSFHWPDASKPRLVLVRLGNSSENFNEWSWSNPIELKELGSIAIRCRHQTKLRNFLLVKITKMISKEVITSEIQRECEEYPMYRIENHSKHFSMVYWQKGKKINKEYLDVLSQIAFGWIDHRLSRVLQVKFYYGTLNDYPIDIMTDTIHEFSLDQLDQRKEIRVHLRQKIGHILYVSTVTDGHTKILKISDVQSAFDMTAKDEKLKYNYFLDVKKIGVSLVIDRERNRSELAYITFGDIKVLTQTFESQLKLQLRLGELQIDNQLSYRVPYPVIFQSTTLKKQHEAEIRSLAFFDTAIILRNTVETAYYFELIDCLIQTMDVKLDDEVLSFIIDFAEHVAKGFHTLVNPTHDIFMEVNREFIKQDTLEMLNMLSESVIRTKQQRVHTRAKLHKHKQSELKIYIAKLRLSPIEIVFSFLKKMRSEGNIMRHAGIILKAIGVAVTNIEASKINLNSVELDHVFGSKEDVLTKIYDYYSSNLIKTALKLIGSIDLIGNPIEFFHTISTGVKDFFYKPIQGFVKGPLQGSTGVYEGTKSLLKNTVVGVFGTVSKITSSWSKGLLALSNDEEYMSRREEDFIRERVETIVDGVGYGISGAFRSVQSGLIGVVKQPIEGARKRGFKGLLKGAFFGITGAMVKPMSGGLDFIARASEGGMNTVTIFEQSVEVRMRNPRPFYSRLQIVRKINKIDA